MSHNEVGHLADIHTRNVILLGDSTYIDISDFPLIQFLFLIYPIGSTICTKNIHLRLLGRESSIASCRAAEWKK